MAWEVDRVWIGELATATATTARALRHYEQAGLISSERATNGYRVYDERAAVRVRNIRYLLAAGLTLDDVRVFLPCLDGDVASAPPSPKGLRVALGRLAVLNQRISAQTEARDRLETALRQATGDRIRPVAGSPASEKPEGPGVATLCTAVHGDHETSPAEEYATLDYARCPDPPHTARSNGPAPALGRCGS